MEEKRTLLALVLSFLVIFVWFKFIYAPTREAGREPGPQSPKTAEQPEGKAPGKEPSARPDPSRPEETDETTPTTPEPKEQPSPEPGPEPEREEALKPQELDEADRPPEIAVEVTTVDTDFVRVALTNRGAALQSLTLKGYFADVENKEPLTLLREFQPRTHSLVLLDAEGKWGWGSWVYERVSDVPEDGARKVVYRTSLLNKRIEVTKTYRFKKQERDFGLEIGFRNLTDAPLEQSFVLRGAAGIVPEFKQCPRGGAPCIDPKNTQMNLRAVVGPAGEDSPEAARIQQVAKALEKGNPVFEGQALVPWVAVENRYFAAVLMADQKNPAPAQGAIAELLKDQEEQQNLAVGLKFATLKLPAREERVLRFRFISLPKKTDELAKYEGLSGLLSYGWFGGISAFFLAILHFFYPIVRNYGIAIILLTVLVRLMLHPLSRKSQTSMHRMQKLAPKMKTLREMYKDDKQKLNQEMMNLYREHNVNPMGGCLPMLLQLPVFIGLWRGLSQSIELRHNGFLWIRDLTRPDALLCLPGTFPVIGNELNLLPLLMLGAMIWQQKMAPKSEDPQAQQQQKMMAWMPIIFVFIFYSMPSGLTLYIFTSTLLGMGEQKLIKRKLAHESTDDEPSPPQSPPSTPTKAGQSSKKSGGKGKKPKSGRKGKK